MNDYIKQLTTECTNSNCTKIFCRRNISQGNINRISEILSKYSNLFQCERIEKLINSTKQEYNYPIIDLYFHVIQYAYNIRKPNTSHKKNILLLNKLKCVHKLYQKKIFKDQKNNDDQKKLIEIDHRLCKLIDKKHDQVDMYLIIGVTHLLLLKFQKKNNLQVALIIVKLFCLISMSGNLDAIYYKSLHNVYKFIYKKMFEQNKEFQLPCSNICNEETGGECLFQFEFTKKSFLNSVETVYKELESSNITNVRENDRIKHLLNIFLILFNINQKNMILSHEHFYLQNFCKKIDLKSEFKYYKSKCETSLNYGFILSLEVKSELFKINNNETMRTSLQDAFFTSLFEGVTDPYLFFNIRRNSLLSDTVKILRNVKNEEMFKQLKIKFVGEDGVDSGGIIKEYFSLLSNDIKTNRKIFDIKNTRLWFKKGANLEYINMIGKIFGIALYNGMILNVPLPFIFFKKMLNIKMTFEDLEEIEPQYCHSIKNLEKCSAIELNALNLTFIANIEVNQEIITKEIVPNGKNKILKKENFHIFKDAFADFYLEKSIAKEFNSFLKGFSSVINLKNISMFHPTELEKLIIGTDEFDFELLESCISYVGYKKNSLIIQHFWDIFHSYSIKEKKALLQFITGNDRSPATGSSGLKLIIMKNGNDSDRLPSSQTCFNTLLLPEYSTKEKLYQKLDKAINLTAGFYLI